MFLWEKLEKSIDNEKQRIEKLTAEDTSIDIDKAAALIARLDGVKKLIDKDYKFDFYYQPAENFGDKLFDMIYDIKEKLPRTAEVDRRGVVGGKKEVDSLLSALGLLEQAYRKLPTIIESNYEYEDDKN